MRRRRRRLEPLSAEIGAIIVIILLAAFPLAWGLSLLLHHDGTYGPSVLLAIGIGLADAAFRPT